MVSWRLMFYFTCFFYPRKVKNCQLRLYDRNNFMTGRRRRVVFALIGAEHDGGGACDLRCLCCWCSVTPTLSLPGIV